MYGWVCVRVLREVLGASGCDMSRGAGDLQGKLEASCLVSALPEHFTRIAIRSKILVESIASLCDVRAKSSTPSQPTDIDTLPDSLHLHSQPSLLHHRPTQWHQASLRLPRAS